MRISFFLLLFLSALISCKEKDKKNGAAAEKPSRVVKVPDFNQDSAYLFVKQQVDFGPRIPNTKQHQLAGDFLIGYLKKSGAQVKVQEFESPTFDGHQLQLRNIIATYYPDKQKRILLAAHWDTRPFADKDHDQPNATFEGANDGGSGVGILLEVARILETSAAPEVGVDIIFFDGEDWGERNGMQSSTTLPDGLKEWWCLGSQYWAKNKHRANYSAYYGILLDMVGASNAQFHREGYSLEFAPGIVDKVWSAGARLGYGHFFVKKNQDGIIDDHLFVNSIAKIPMIDIVSYDPGSGFFGDWHHSRKDNFALISKETLDAVGTTLVNVIYYEE
jgi:Zn-dependent M28 family amino/carboxypeptidase